MEKLIAFDWNTERDESDAFFWAAWVDNPGLPEPHCYGNGVSYTGNQAIAYIRAAQNLRSDQLQSFVRSLLVG